MLIILYNTKTESLSFCTNFGKHRNTLSESYLSFSSEVRGPDLENLKITLTLLEGKERSE